MVQSRIARQVGSRFLKKGCRRTKPILLQMNKRAGQLDQSLVKPAIGAMASRQPQFLEHIVCFVEQSAVETFKKAEIVGGQFTVLATLNQGCNFRALFTHRLIVADVAT